MEPMIVPPEILDRFNGSLTLNVEVPVAPHAVCGIPEYRCKVYRSLLNLEMHRFSVARLKNDSLLFPKSSGIFALNLGAIPECIRRKTGCLSLTCPAPERGSFRRVC